MYRPSCLCALLRVRDGRPGGDAMFQGVASPRLVRLRSVEGELLDQGSQRQRRIHSVSSRHVRSFLNPRQRSVSARSGRERAVVSSA